MVRGTNPLLHLDPQKYYHLCFEVFIFSTKFQNKFTSPPHHPALSLIINYLAIELKEAKNMWLNVPLVYTSADS